MPEMIPFTRVHLFRRAPALFTALALLCCAAISGELTSAHAATASTSSTPTFPVPASERVHSSATSSAPAAATPTTTYVPAGGAAAPGATGASPGTATPAPTVSIPATATPPAAAAPAQTAASTQTNAARTKSSEGDRPLSTGAILIAALAVLLLFGCLGWALARRRAFEPHWLLSLRHAIAEAGFRVSATWSEFADWARLGH